MSDPIQPVPWTVGAALESLGESAVRGNVAERWEDSMATLPKEGPPRFLEPTTLTDYAVYAGLEPPVIAALHALARRVAGNTGLLQLAWHACCRVFEGEKDVQLADWPSLENALGRDAGGFYLLVALDLVPRLRVSHAANGIPEEVTRETCRQIWSFADNYSRGNSGLIGVYFSQLGWLGNYLNNPYYRLGRFEYWLKPYARETRAFRNRMTGETVALAADNQKFMADGSRPSASETTARPDDWMSRMIVVGDSVQGNPILPTGYGINTQATLSTDVWECKLKQGDWILDMHIPAGGGMSMSAAADSFQRARTFFARRYPERMPVAISCVSWIFSPILESILPADSNLVSLLREVYLIPTPSGGQDGLWFVFFQKQIDPRAAPRATSLQRAVADYLMTGRRWHIGAMFLLIEDIDRFGSQPYRRPWNSLCVRINNETVK